MTARRLLLYLVALPLMLVASGCQDDPVPDMFTGPVNLGGTVVDAATLNQGLQAYTNYCYACHGVEGDGRGPAAWGLRPPPRDFRTATYKFAGSVDGLPHDEDLLRIVKGGLHGTAMLPWDIEDKELNAIVQYIKTFSPPGEGFKDPDEVLGDRIVAPADPWAGKKDEGVARGKKIYHGLATCWSCHPAYATKMEIYEASAEVGNKPITDFRQDLYYPEAKESEYVVEGKKVKILPPDFTFMPVRSASSAEELFRVIGAGIPGTAMPQWYGTVPDSDLWAMSHYVQSLISAKDTGAAAELRKKMAEQPPFEAPVEGDDDDSASGEENVENGAPAPAAD